MINLQQIISKDIDGLYEILKKQIAQPEENKSIIKEIFNFIGKKKKESDSNIKQISILNYDSPDFPEKPSKKECEDYVEIMSDIFYNALSKYRKENKYYQLGREIHKELSNIESKGNVIGCSLEELILFDKVTIAPGKITIKIDNDRKEKIEGRKAEKVNYLRNFNEFYKYVKKERDELKREIE